MKGIGITIWGATGFTGALVAEYFATTVSKQHPSLRWAIAGRNRTKLEAVRAAITPLLPPGAPAPALLVASIDDQASIDAIAQQSKVMLSTAGPFVRLGTPIVDACIRHGCHYTDITGETPWVRSLVDRYDEAAKAAGVVVVPMCGFDSIPSDLGAFVAATTLMSRFQSPAKEVRGYFVSNGGPSGGTLASGQNMMSTPSLQQQFDTPFLLGGGPGGPGGPGGAGAVRAQDRDVSKEGQHPRFKFFTAPFGMAKINTRVVRRSAELARRRATSQTSQPAQPAQGGGAPCNAPSPYAADFHYNEEVIAPSLKAAKKMANPPPPAVIKKLIDAGRLPGPGMGPSRKQRAHSYFGALFAATASDGHEVVVTVSGGDPGYTETSKMVSEAAVCLALGSTPQAVGVLTPSAALGHTLVARLAAAGLAFQAHHGPVDAKTVAGLIKGFIPTLKSKL